MTSTICLSRRLLGWAVTTVLGCASSGGLAEAGAAVPACPGAQVAVAERCVGVEEATARIDAIIGEAMTKYDLKAVLAGVSIDGKPLTLTASGESMTGVPATRDMTFPERCGCDRLYRDRAPAIGRQRRPRRRRPPVEVVPGLSQSRSGHPHHADQRHLG